MSCSERDDCRPPARRRLTWNRVVHTSSFVSQAVSESCVEDRRDRGRGRRHQHRRRHGRLRTKARNRERLADHQLGGEADRSDHGLTRSNHRYHAMMSSEESSIAKAKLKACSRMLFTAQAGTRTTRRLLCCICGHRCFSFSCA